MFKWQSPEPVLDNSRAEALQRAYKLSVFWSRLIGAAFFTTYAIAMFYMIPWFPGGLSAANYTMQDAAALMLLFVTAATAFATVNLRERARSTEQALVGWSSVHEGLNDLRQREFFFDRIVFECARARTSSGQFTVIALRLDEATPMDIKTLNRAIAALKPVIREADCAAAMGPHEICVLAPRVYAAASAGFSEDLRQLAQDALGGHPVRAGWAVYGRDGIDAGDLIGRARRALNQEPEVRPTAHLAEAQSTGAA